MSSRARLVPTLVLLALMASPALAADRDARVIRADALDPAQRSQVYEAEAREKRHEAISMLAEMVKKTPTSDPRRSELIFRLAELYMDEARDLRLGELAVSDGPDDPNVVLPSTRWTARALGLYQEIVQQHPDYARAVDATWSLAAALDDLGRGDEAASQRVNLVRTWPESAYTAQAYVLIGEHYFEGNDAFRAALAYDKAARLPDNHWTAFALYKLAWCQYNLGQGDQIETMARAVQASTPAPGESDQGKITLRDEALRDLVRFLADNGDVDEAHHVLDRLGHPELVHDMLARLGDLQLENGRNEEAMQTWRRLLAEDPSSPGAPEIQSRIVGAQRKLGRPADALASLEAARKTYGPGSPWARTNAARPDAVSKAGELLEKDLRDLALSSHQEALKLAGDAAKRAFAVADRAYADYLDAFPAVEHATEMRFAYAELLYKIHRYDGAYAQYMAVVNADPKGTHGREAAEDAIFAAEGMGKGQPAPASGLSPSDEALVAACKQMLELYPGDKTRAVLYKIAYRLYERGQLAEATPYFKQVIALDPASKDAEQAANLILDSYVQVSDWEHLVDVARAFRDQQGLGSAAFKADVARIYENARLKQIETGVAARGEHRAAGDAFLVFAQEFPSSANADLALNNAAAHYDQASDADRAMSAREALLSAFPTSRFATDNLALLAYGVENVADFPRAAALYEQLFRRDPAHKASREAIYSAALFRKVMGDYAGSVRDYQAFLAAYPDDARGPDVRLGIGRQHEDHAQWGVAAQVYLAFFLSPPAGASDDQLLFARVHYGLDQEKVGASKDRVAKHWEDTLAWYQGERSRGVAMADGPDLAAEVLYQRLQPTLERYHALRITAPPGRGQDRALVAALNARLEALNGVERGLQEIVETGSATWGLAALVELGGAYEDMASALAEAPVPAGLNEDQRRFYQDGIDQRVYAMNQKAINVYDLCVKRAFELERYDDSARAALARLRQLDPETWTPLEEEIQTASYTAGAVRRAGFIEEP